MSELLRILIDMDLLGFGTFTSAFSASGCSILLFPGVVEAPTDRRLDNRQAVYIHNIEATHQDAPLPLHPHHFILRRAEVSL